MRKIICLIMVVLLFCATCVPVMADAQEIDGSGITWELTDNDTTLTISGTGDMPYFQIPFDRPWHSAASTITTVKINSGVTSIGVNAFALCPNLQNLTIPSSVTSIGECAFMRCQNLQNITIPSSVTSIGMSAFYGCQNLQSIDIPSSVPSICDNAFYGCWNLQSITIPSSVISIGEKAFANCGNLKTVTFRSSTPPSCDGTVELRSTTIYVPYGAADAYKTTIDLGAVYISEAYMVDILPTQHGTITVSKDFFVASGYTEGSETVQVNAIPDEGYQLKSLTLSDAETSTDITEDMSFTMPCDNVTLTAEFEPAENEAGSFISEGNLWIIIAVATIAIGCATFLIIKRKKVV